MQKRLLTQNIFYLKDRVYRREGRILMTADRSTGNPSNSRAHQPVPFGNKKFCDFHCATLHSVLTWGLFTTDTGIVFFYEHCTTKPRPAFVWFKAGKRRVWYCTHVVEHFKTIIFLYILSFYRKVFRGRKCHAWKWPISLYNNDNFLILYSYVVRDNKIVYNRSVLCSENVDLLLYANNIRIRTVYVLQHSFQKKKNH